MTKHLIVLGIAVLLICVGLSGCTGLNSAINDSANCCIAGFISCGWEYCVV